MCDVRWTLTHHDIDFDALLLRQIANHFPNTGAEIGTKVGGGEGLAEEGGLSANWGGRADEPGVPG